MVTTRSGSRAASEVPATPTKSSTSPPNSAATPKGSASPKRNTPASRAARALLNRERSATGSPAPTRGTRSKAGTPAVESAPDTLEAAAASTPTKAKPATSTPASPRPTTVSSRRRARQKDRVRALRAASTLPTPQLTADPELTKALREALTEVLASAEADSVCPTRAPRALALAHPDKYPDWTALIPAAREVVWDEAQKGRVVVLHAVGEAKGVPVPMGERMGAEVRIRVRRAVVKAVESADAEAIVVDEE